MPNCPSCYRKRIQKGPCCLRGMGGVEKSRDKSCSTLVSQHLHMGTQGLFHMHFDRRYQELRSSLLRGSDITWRTSIHLFKLCQTRERLEEYSSAPTQWKSQGYQEPNRTERFNKRYARKGEVDDALEKAEFQRHSAQKQVKEMAKVKLASREIEDCLLDSCIAGDEQKLIIDLLRLLKSGATKRKPVQILVWQNLVSKLLKNNNHHYASIIKDLSALFKNELGPTNYSLLAEAFGLARATTAAKHGSEICSWHQQSSP